MHGDHPVQTDLDISLTKEGAGDGQLPPRSVNITGRAGNVDISAQHSDTSVEDISANVKVSQEKGTVKVQQITGDVQVGRTGSARLPSLT